MILYFEDDNEDIRILEEIDSNQPKDDVYNCVFKSIYKFCDANNFHIYYTRMWNEELNGVEMTKIDVGSHCEFFYTDPKLF